VDEHAWDFLGWGGGSVGDPTAECLDFGGLKRRPVVGHPFDVAVGTFQCLNEEAFGGFSRADCGSGFAPFSYPCGGI
jgi:hypothetical protein